MRIATPPMGLQDVIEMANVFFRSGMFTDAKDATHFIVKIQAGQELGIPPFQAVTGIHVIQGKPVMGAGILAARVKSSGKYDFDNLEHTDIVCKLEFFQNMGNGKRKSLGESVYTIEDAKRAGVKNLEKMPRNMLFARAVSNGVRWFCADIFSGPVYTPEEFDQVTEDATAVVTTQNPGGLSDSERAAISAATTKDPAPIITMPTGAGKSLPTLDSNHPDWANCINFLKSGATVDKLRVRFSVTPEAEALLLAAANTRPVTQEQIHQNNAGYAGPDPAAPVEDDLDTDKPF